jgi:hypothetical protein
MSGDEPLANVKKATAILFACVVDAMSESDPAFKDRFLSNLGEGYAKIREDSDELSALELLSWTRTMITGFSHVEGQQKPFLKS